MDIAKIFKSKTRKELFRLYFTNPDNEYYLRELERILDTPVSMIRKELTHLEDAGIFTSSKKGNLAYYSINKAYPLFEELKSIVFKTIGVQGLLKETLKKIKGIVAAFIYGSVAKKEEDVKSDVDLFIIGRIDETRTLREIGKLEKILKREINYSVFTKEEFKKKTRVKDPFIMDLLENPKIFIVGSKDDL
ncbi:MAG TPA: nucleotidyltransferase domain-containing protein [Candidatus Wujingus californicus]|uniref:nucleotidyltransferase domain-containing protein n=2 Tax=Candidatus Wujingus californicus TaxID=3367618 RepID=UPI001DA1CAB0|nr:nucleotidyltransferase domain-containing protein [Planctomycetota bacterium]MDO8131953.1 nucleotidyltransferase domain-containing protein [Candidatus Brocadiales bacterium]